MVDAHDGPAFYIEIQCFGARSGGESRTHPPLVTFCVSPNAGASMLESIRASRGLWLPQLAPSSSLVNQYTRGQIDGHAFERRYSMELERHPVECERLRALACTPGVVVLTDTADVDVLTAGGLRRHLQRLECEHRWSQGLMIGGYLYPLHEKIIRSGGLWFARHKAWMMPDQATWRYIHSLLPVDF